MRRELNAALVECSHEVMPESMSDFICRKKARSGLRFWSTRYASEGLWLFARIDPDAKQDGIQVHIGWTTEEAMPDHVPLSLLSSEIRGREIELPVHELPLKFFFQNMGDFYEVLPLALTVEDAMEAMKPLEPERARSLVKATLRVIREDLDQYIPDYFVWVAEQKRVRNGEVC